MKFRLIITSIATLAVSLPLLLVVLPAAAIAPTIEGGNIYRIKNITQGTDFLDPNNAKACDVLQYKVRIHNGGPDEPLNNVTVQAAFPSGALTQNVSTVTVRASNASPSSTTDTATLNIATPQTLTYVAGSTQLLNSSGGVIGGLPDGITGAGVSIGTVGISLAEERFVQFKMQVDCPPPPTPAYKCENLQISSNNQNRTVAITAFTTSASGGAVFRTAVISWGDNSTPLTSANPVGQTHTYAADGTYTITATAHFTMNGQDVTNTGPECTKQVTFKNVPPPPEKPVYKCEKLEVSADNKDRKVTITAFNTSASGGAEFKNVVITWGDNSTALTSTNPVGQSHSYAADGTYTITATAHFTVNGQDKTASGPQCTTQVTFKEKQPPHVKPPKPPTPPTPPSPPASVTPTPPASPSATPTGSVGVSSSPTTLVATGPAGVVAVFSGVSLAGSLAYRLWIGRRIGSE